jgi:hypothetical protein
MFWAFKFNFVVDILAHFGLETIWAIFLKISQLKKIFWSPKEAKAKKDCQCCFGGFFVNIFASVHELNQC